MVNSEGRVASERRDHWASSGRRRFRDARGTVGPLHCERRSSTPMRRHRWHTNSRHHLQRFNSSEARRRGSREHRWHLIQETPRFI